VNPPRTLPEVTAATAHFWTSGARGALELLRCSACGYWVHPPGPVCPRCLGKPHPEPVSGRGVVHTFTVNVHPWQPGLEVPYVIAIVELAEQEALRLTTNIVDCAPSDVYIGMPVEVTFEHVEDVYLPMFRPVDNG
jgi:uncharacterized protein